MSLFGTLFVMSLFKNKVTDPNEVKHHHLTSVWIRNITIQYIMRELNKAVLKSGKLVWTSTSDFSGIWQRNTG